MKQTDNFKFDEANVMNELVYRNLSEDEKRQICAWKYGGEYDLYNLPAYEELQKIEEYKKLLIAARPKE